jgi:prepilin-type N-terminal cleavage/methylation domain-containing protein
MKQKSKIIHHGFTLIELLVVVSVIGLLSSIILVSLNSARLKARNVRRNEDISQLIKAFSLAYSTTPSYPVGGWFCVSSSCTDGFSTFGADPTLDAFLAPYIQKPTDPPNRSRGYGGYIYANAWSGGTGPYDGSAFLPGVYLNWILETGNNPSCGPGKIWVIAADYTNCLYRVDY